VSFSGCPHGRNIAGVLNRMLGIDAMARFALSILWGAGLCGIGFIAVAFWLEAIAGAEGDRKDGAAVAAFFSTAVFVGLVFWTLSLADLFQLWEWVGRRGK